MAETERILEFENVNGVALTLKILMREDSPLSRLFTVTFKSEENKRTWPQISLILAVFFNIVAFIYIQISLTVLAIILIVLSFLLFFWITHSVQSESVLVIPTVGIQCIVKFVHGREHNFIPWHNIDDVIINEVIKRNRVLYYLTVLVKNINYDNVPMKLVPLFKYTKPRLVMLETVYTELQELLTEAHAQQPYREAGDMGYETL